MCKINSSEVPVFVKKLSWVLFTLNPDESVDLETEGLGLPLKECFKEVSPVKGTVNYRFESMYEEDEPLNSFSVTFTYEQGTDPTTYNHLGDDSVSEVIIRLYGANRKNYIEIATGLFFTKCINGEYIELCYYDKNNEEHYDSRYFDCCDFSENPKRVVIYNEGEVFRWDKEEDPDSVLKELLDVSNCTTRAILSKFIAEDTFTEKVNMFKKEPVNMIKKEAVRDLLAGFPKKNA